MPTSQHAPFFSVIIPVYNRRERIDQAVHSVLAQTFTDHELIIVDDGSTDGSWEHLQTYTDPRIRVLRNAVNSERCATRNKGIAMARGQYICFLDSDDHHLPHHLESLHRLITAQGSPKAFFFSDAWNEDEQGGRTERLCPDFQKFDPFTYFLRFTVNPQRWAVHCEVMHRHLFDPEVNICEDMDTSLRMAAAGVPVFQLRERTTCYVAASDSFTHGASDKWERELKNLKRIFARPQLKGKLPKQETDRLLSACHYHLAQQAFLRNDAAGVRSHGLRSFHLCPTGYNGKTNRPLAVMLLYSLPLLGPIVRAVVRMGAAEAA
ncbi:MAG: glycosyltransferase family 2 protein [Flavobacteriales bacterium]|nr:glycosyltransferase family 2 protein [Flavobacteriales bacterium]